MEFGFSSSPFLLDHDEIAAHPAPGSVTPQHPSLFSGSPSSGLELYLPFYPLSQADQDVNFSCPARAAGFICKHPCCYSASAPQCSPKKTSQGFAPGVPNPSQPSWSHFPHDCLVYFGTFCLILRAEVLPPSGNENIILWMCFLLGIINFL